MKLKDVIINGDASLRKPAITVIPKIERRPYIATSYPDKHDLSDPTLYLFKAFVGWTMNGIPASDVYEAFQKINEFREVEERWNKLELPRKLGAA